MHRLASWVVSALAASWVTASTAHVAPQFAAKSICPRGGKWVDELEVELVKNLSDSAEVYFPGSSEFEAASTRWSELDEPNVNVVVVPGTAEDVAQTVAFANKKDVPFLAYNGAHGALTTLGGMDYGIEIFMQQLSSVEIDEGGESVTIGGGTMSKQVIDTLWEAGKQAVTGTCECVSYLGPALGGGHGWLQGHHGLIGDQFVSLDIVLADGTLETIDADSDLFWAMNGAGHNFGIVTSATIKIWDIEHRDWAIETITFSGDKVEAVYDAVNEHLLQNGTQPVGVINWSYWLNNPEADPENPVIVLYIIQEGVTAVDAEFTGPFHDIGPISAEPIGGDYNDLAEWTGIATSSPPCQKAGLANPRFPIYLDTYNVAAQKEAWDLFSSEADITSPFNNSIFMFEGYSLQGVKAIDDDYSAFPYRGDNFLAAPLISYAPVGDALDQQAAELGSQLRDILHQGSGRNELHAYVNYAFGDETPKDWYGSESWRQERLRSLKNKYDPEGRFSFYAPIV